jgi:hypothetical protein
MLIDLGKLVQNQGGSMVCLLDSHAAWEVGGSNLGNPYCFVGIVAMEGISMNQTE